MEWSGGCLDEGFKRQVGNYFRMRIFYEVAQKFFCRDVHTPAPRLGRAASPDPSKKLIGLDGKFGIGGMR